MPKKILVVDTTDWDNCSYCPACCICPGELWFCQAKKNVFAQDTRIFDKHRIPDWCLLKELPPRQKILSDEELMEKSKICGITTQRIDGYDKGWNDCLDTIMQSEG